MRATIFAYSKQQYGGDAQYARTHKYTHKRIVVTSAMTIIAKIRGQADKIASKSQVSRRCTHLHGPVYASHRRPVVFLIDPHANRAKSNRSTVTRTRVRDNRSLLTSVARHYVKLFEYHVLYGHGLPS
ncbi:unnamed protein product [Lasius platythorax]|uniref:Uncharacterized protein n=1 Tax=Lasius platythorax TaxID=488582 RepID=A0AAV2NZ33_9HYME